MPCTTILAGPKATEDGALYISRNEDCSPDDEKRLVYHPAVKNTEGSVFRSFRNDFTWPLPPESLAYLSVSDSATDGASEGEAGFNEAGVGITATETIFASAASLAIDPYLPKTGVIEDSLEDSVLPFIHSAREGVLLLGKQVETAGAGEGCGVAFVDSKEIWWFETCSGHRWAAVRLPDDACYVTANHARLQEFDPEDTENCLGSPDLISFAEEHGLWKAGARPFNVRKAYVDENTVRDTYYNFARNRVLLEKYCPSLRLKPEEDLTFPVFVKPESKLTFASIASGLRNRYEGTDSDPYQTDNPHTAWRPISVFRCSQSHILQLKPWLPLAVGAVTWVSWGMPSLGVFVPVFQGAKWFPKAYGIGTHDADSISAGWAFRKAQTLAMTDYRAFEPIVRRVWDAWEREAEERVNRIQIRYTALVEKSVEEADRFLQLESDRILEDALTRARALENELMTLLTRKISAKFPFNGA